MSQQASLKTLLIYTSTMVIAFTAWVSLSSLIVQLEDIYQWSLAERNTLVALPILLGSLARMPFGILADRFGARKVYSILLASLMIPSIGLAFSNSLGEYFFWGLWMALAGTAFPLGIVAVAKASEGPHQGYSLGLLGIGNVGTALAGILLPVLASRLGLSSVFLLLAALLGISFLTVRTGDPGTAAANPAPSLADILTTFKHKMVWILSLFYLVTFGGFIAISLYLPALVVDYYHMPEDYTGYLIAMITLMATLTRPLGGFLADTRDVGKVLSLVFLLLGASVSAFGIGLNSFPIMVIAAATAGIVVGVGNGVIVKLIPVYFPNNVGTAAGIICAAGGSGGLLPPILMGSVREVSGGYEFGFLLLIVLTLLCVVINSYFIDNKKTSVFL